MIENKIVILYDDLCECGAKKLTMSGKCLDCIEKARFEIAEKIAIDDYRGYMVIDENITDNYDFIYDYVYEMMSSDDEPPDYLWAAEPDSEYMIGRLQLQDIIYDLCDCSDVSYEMYDRLDTDSPLLKEAQDIIDEWIEENKHALTIYTESRTKAVLLDSLIDDVRKQIAAEQE